MPVSTNTTADPNYWLAAAPFLLADALVLLAVAFEPVIRKLVERDVEENIPAGTLLPGALQPAGVADRAIWASELFQLLVTPAAAVGGLATAIPAKLGGGFVIVVIAVFLLGMALFGFAVSRGSVRYLSGNRMRLSVGAWFTLALNTLSVGAVRLLG